MSPAVWTHLPHKPAERASRQKPLLELTLACFVSIFQVWKGKKIERGSKKRRICKETGGREKRELRGMKKVEGEGGARGERRETGCTLHNYSCSLELYF